MASIMTYNNIFKLSNNTKDKDKDNKNKLIKIKEILNEMKLNLDIFFHKSTLISNLPSITKNGIILYHLYIYINTTFKNELRIFINKYIKIKYEIIDLYKSIRKICINFYKKSVKIHMKTVLINIRFLSSYNKLHRHIPVNKKYYSVHDDNYFKIFFNNNVPINYEALYDEKNTDTNDITLNHNKFIIIKEKYKKALNKIINSEFTNDLKIAATEMIHVLEVYNIFMIYTDIISDKKVDIIAYKNKVNIEISEYTRHINEKIFKIEKEFSHFNYNMSFILNTYIINILEYYNSNFRDKFINIIKSIFLLDPLDPSDNKYVKLVKNNVKIKLLIPKDLESSLSIYADNIKDAIILKDNNYIINYDKIFIHIYFNKIFDKSTFKILQNDYDITNIIKYFKILNKFYDENDDLNSYIDKNYYDILFVLITNFLLTFSEIINILLYYLNNIEYYYPNKKNTFFKIKYKYGPIHIINSHDDNDYINDEPYLKCDKDNTLDFKNIKDDYADYDNDTIINDTIINDLIKKSEEDINESEEDNEFEYNFDKDIDIIFNELLSLFILPRLLLIDSIYKKNFRKIKLYYFSHFKC